MRLKTYIMCKKPYWLRSQKCYVDCGHCLSCRMKKSNEWSLRLKHECYTQNQRACMVTLTYRDEFLPPYKSLCKYDVQELIRKLRKNHHLKFKYFVAGEYGPKTSRPHYHILFLGLDKAHEEEIFNCWSMCTRDHFDCQNVDGNGLLKYVTGYVGKKLGKYYNKTFDPNREPEFQLQSKGIGKYYCINYCHEARKDGVIYDEGKERCIPRYYRKLLGVDSSVFADKIYEKERKQVETVQRYNKDVTVIVSDLGRSRIREKFRTVLGSSFIVGGYYVSPDFYKLVQVYREENDYRLMHNFAKWRGKVE